MQRFLARAGLIAYLPCLAAGQAATAPAAFEVASVKLCDPGQTGGGVWFMPGGRFTATNTPIHFLIQRVYGLRDFQIVGPPNLMALIADRGGARYTIEAKADPAATQDQLRLMAQALLADRFQLKAHRETRELPVYALVAAKGGFKIQPLPKDAKRGGIENVTKGRQRGSGVDMSYFISALSRNVDRPILDKTSFTDLFNFNLEWSPDQSLAGPDGTASDPNGASIFTALQDQLGLKLEPRKEPVEVLVIDHVAKPSEN